MRFALSAAGAQVGVFRADSAGQPTGKPISLHDSRGAAIAKRDELEGAWKFDPEKCRQHRLAAANQASEALPFRFLSLAEIGEQLARGTGSLPETPEASLERINALLPQGAQPLTREDVFLHVLEAGNGNLIPDRWMFLDGTTLRNVALEAPQGRALMNSHRTGSMCAPAELPYGKTFAARYE